MKNKDKTQEIIKMNYKELGHTESLLEKYVREVQKRFEAIGDTNLLRV